MTIDRARLAYDNILQKPTRGIPSWLIHPMEHRVIERLAGVAEGTYRQKPAETYHAMQTNIGTCLLDQWIPTNPLSMGDRGFESGTTRGATTGAEEIVRDGIRIDSPETVIEHMERFAFPQLKKAREDFNEEQTAREIIANEQRIQNLLGPAILKSGYAFLGFPCLPYSYYGYANYFMAYALYPEIMERHFSLQADLAVKKNRAAARAYREGNLVPLYRLDHDIADSRGTLADIRSLDKLWFPHFARSLEPILKTDVRLIWHCDGNLMEMVPRLLEVGLRGFQGFQYEDGMDYEKICKMKDREGRDLIIIGGVSVTRTLPRGTPTEVKDQMVWLVQHGPKTGLFLGCSSSMTPGVTWENIKMLIEGFHYYQTHGRG